MKNEINKFLVKKAKKGDKIAFSKLYEQVYKDMYKYALYMLGSSEDAEDVVSDTVLDAYKGIHGLKDDTLFRNWIFKILSNKCKEKRKQYTYCCNAVEGEEEFYEENFESRCDLEAAFGELDQEERTVVSMAVFAGYKSSEIGEKLNINPATVRSKLSRALKKMQNKLERNGDSYGLG